MGDFTADFTKNTDRALLSCKSQVFSGTFPAIFDGAYRVLLIRIDCVLNENTTEILWFSIPSIILIPISFSHILRPNGLPLT